MVASSDFKKIKAKVGKRAPVKANVTDTSFKAVGLHVSKQVGVTASADASQSATTTRRGLTLHQLLTQLRHPTVAVRLAAVKGLKSLFNGPALIHQRLISYLSDIVVALAPSCCIDDDPAVRKAAVQTFQELVQSLNQSSNNEPSQVRLLVPFLPYLIAIVATGLNSLDIQQRYDGAAMVRWLFERIQIISDDVMHNAMVQLVPPLTRLLAVAPNRVAVVTSTSSGNSAASSARSSDVTVKQADFRSMVMPVGTMKKSKKSKKRQRSLQHAPSDEIQGGFEERTASSSTSPDSTNSPKYAVLMAIHVVFRTAKAMASLHPSSDFQGIGEDSDMVAVLTPDLNLHPRQKHSSLLFAQNQNLDQVIQLSCVRNPISSLAQFPSWSQLSMGESGEILHDYGYQLPKQSQIKGSSGCMTLSAMEVLDLLSKIRDSAIECSQSNESQQFLLGVISVRFVLECNENALNPGCLSSSGSSNAEDISRRVLKLCSQLGSCIVESFPLFDSHSKDIAEMSLTLLSLATTMLQWVQLPRLVPNVNASKLPKQERQDSQVRHWIQLVSSHIRSLLMEDMAVLENATSQDPNDTTPATPQHVVLLTSQAILSVFAQLLLRKDLHPHFDLKDKVAFLFCSVFFNVDRQLPDSLSRSDVGQYAAFLGCRMISANDYCLDRTEQEFGQNIIFSILRRIPSFLSQWRADYLTSTAICLSTLKSVVYRMDCFDMADKRKSGFLTKLWIGIESLLCPLTCSNSCSVFEMYPESLQRRVVCLICMSGRPTASTIKCLADVCARCCTKAIIPNGKIQQTVSTTMSSFIIQCIHNIRRTLAMQSYIAFLLDATGFLTLDRISVSPGIFMSLSHSMDLQLRDISKCLVHCGTTKVMPMIEALLSVWLSVGRAGVLIDQLNMLKARAGLCLLAVFSLDFQAMNSTNVSISHIVSTDFMEILTKGIADITSVGLISVFESHDDPSLRRWILPILVLFGSEKRLLTRVFGIVTSTLKDLDVCTQSRILDVWSILFKEPRIQTMLLLDRLDILDLASKIYPADHDTQIPSVARMIAELEIACNVVAKS